MSVGVLHAQNLWKDRRRIKLGQFGRGLDGPARNDVSHHLGCDCLKQICMFAHNFGRKNLGHDPPHMGVFGRVCFENDACWSPGLGILEIHQTNTARRNETLMVAKNFLCFVISATGQDTVFWDKSEWSLIAQFRVVSIGVGKNFLVIRVNIPDRYTDGRVDGEVSFDQFHFVCLLICRRLFNRTSSSGRTGPVEEGRLAIPRRSASRTRMARRPGKSSPWPPLGRCLLRRTR